MIHPFFSRKPEREEAWIRHEEDLATYGRRTKASGSTNHVAQKGDVHTANLVIECKSTFKKSYQVTLEVLSKVAKEAHEAGKIPALAIRFEGRDKLALHQVDDWIVVPMKWLMERHNERR